MSNLSTLPKGDSAWLLRKAIERIMQQISVLETNIGSSTTGNSNDTEIIFNDAGTLRGDKDFAWNKTSNILTVDGSATITGDLTVDTSTLYVSSSTDKVGIGTTSLSGEKLTVAGNISANAWLGRGNIAVPSGDCSIFRSADNTLGFGIASTTAMTLNSTGLGVGEAASVSRFQSRGSTSDSSAYVIYAKNSGGSVINFMRNDGRFLVGNGTTDNLIVTETGNVGIGVTPSAWNSNYNGLDIGQNGCIAGRAGTSNTVDVASNGFRNTSGNWAYKLATSNAACRYQLDGSTGSHIWYSGAAGTAGNTIAGFSTALMTLDASGNLILQSPSSPPTLATNGQLTVNATSNTNLRFSYRGSDGTTRVANITLA